jgi:hypothetical protein
MRLLIGPVAGEFKAVNLTSCYQTFNSSSSLLQACFKPRHPEFTGYTALMIR